MLIASRAGQPSHLQMGANIWNGFLWQWNRRWSYRQRQRRNHRTSLGPAGDPAAVPGSVSRGQSHPPPPPPPPPLRLPRCHLLSHILTPPSERAHPLFPPVALRSLKAFLHTHPINARAQHHSLTGRWAPRAGSQAVLVITGSPVPRVPLVRGGAGTVFVE